jgi:hypothetical protein
MDEVREKQRLPRGRALALLGFAAVLVDLLEPLRHVFDLGKQVGCDEKRLFLREWRWRGNRCGRASISTIFRSQLILLLENQPRKVGGVLSTR